VIQFTTRRLNHRLITGKSAIGRLVAVYKEILSFPDDNDEVCATSTNSNNNGNDNNGDGGNHSNSDSNGRNSKEAHTMATTQSVKRKCSGPPSTATRIVRQRQLNSPQPETTPPPAPSTLPLALRRRRRPTPFPMLYLSPLYETFGIY